MNTNYQTMLEELEGSSQSTPSNFKEPNWMIKIMVADKAITKSSTEEYKEFSYIHDYKFVLTRGIESAGAHAIRPDGGLTAHDLKVIIPSSSITSAINVAFSENNEVSTIELIRLALIKNKQDTVEAYTFTTCFVSGIITKGDILGLSFRYSTIQRKQTEYEQNGTKGGSHTAEHNLIKSTSAK